MRFIKLITTIFFNMIINSMIKTASMADMVYNQFQKEGMENVDWTLYDSMFTTAGSTQTLKFFQNSTSLGKARTNMTVAGQLSDPQAFLITSIDCIMFNKDGSPFTETGAGTAVVYPLNTIMAQMYFRIHVSPKDLFESHGRLLYSQVDNGISTSSSGTQTTNINNVFFKRSYRFQVPIIILPQRHFELEATFTTPAEAGGYTAANTLMLWLFRGILRRNSN